MKVLLPLRARPFLEPHLPADVEAVYYANSQEALEGISGAEVAWLDLFAPPWHDEILAAGNRLCWTHTMFAGVADWPLHLFKARHIPLTNGAGVAAIPIAEFAVMGMIAMGKGLPDIVRAHDRREWLTKGPGSGELWGSKALILGFGAIGREIAARLRPFDVEVTAVRRSPTDEPGVIGPNDWRTRLGEFDWVILATPGNAETEKMLGAAEFAAMKTSAVLVNIARGGIVDQEALICALNEGKIGAAFLDVTSPEPLPADHPLWRAKNTVITSHMSAAGSHRMPERGSALFLDNLARFRKGEPFRNLVDFDLGY
jgi:phosphoglycerate dehydrogenase-like enzyme